MSSCSTQPAWLNSTWHKVRAAACKALHTNHGSNRLATALATPHYVVNHLVHVQLPTKLGVTSASMCDTAYSISVAAHRKLHM
jgi:hypothetical protein